MSSGFFFQPNASASSGGGNSFAPFIFKANANTGTFTTSFVTVRTWDQNILDPAGAFNATSGIVTMPYNAVVTVFAEMYGSIAGSTQFVGLAILQNGVTQRTENYGTAGLNSNANPVTSTLLSLLAGDTIAIQGIAAANNAINTTTQRNTWWIMGYRST